MQYINARKYVVAFFLLSSALVLPALGQSPEFVRYESVAGESWINPYSVYIDIDSLSPTFGRLFAHGDFRIKFLFGSVLPLDSVYVDSNLWVPRTRESRFGVFRGVLNRSGYCKSGFIMFLTCAKINYSIPREFKRSRKLICFFV